MPRKTRQFGLRSAVPGSDRTRTAANRDGTYRCCGKSLSSASSSGSIREIPVQLGTERDRPTGPTRFRNADYEGLAGTDQPSTREAKAERSRVRAAMLAVRYLR